MTYLSKRTQSACHAEAREVQDFYERYPYPRPVDSLENIDCSGRTGRGRRADYHLFWPASPYREDRTILVAGCGTSQAAKHALRWPEAQVIGHRLQRNERALHRGAQAQIQPEQSPAFASFRSSGSANWRRASIRSSAPGCCTICPIRMRGSAALRSVLKPDGAMHLMVYAPYGRTGIYMLQEFCRRVGIHATDEGIRDLIAALKALPPGHPLENLLREAPDFRQEAALADALLNPQDRAYSVPQLFDFLERGGLTFGRWLRQAALQPTLRRHGRRSRRLHGLRSFRWPSNMPPSNCSGARWYAQRGRLSRRQSTVAATTQLYR